MALLLGCGGCGAKGGLVTDEARDGGGVVDTCTPPSRVRGVVGTVDGPTCSLEGLGEDGRVHRMTCAVSGASPALEFAGCVWVTDGETVCGCDQPDWASTCPNGVPICGPWAGSFDFALDVTFER
ncbi:MAG: hypothetical protein JRH11_04610 [Deltaproteobacteria bacterium]|nr:hypothetical protein [Deltaproteobacteria bacterium]